MRLYLVKKQERVQNWGAIKGIYIEIRTTTCNHIRCSLDVPFIFVFKSQWTFWPFQTKSFTICLADLTSNPKGCFLVGLMYQTRPPKGTHSWGSWQRLFKHLIPVNLQKAPVFGLAKTTAKNWFTRKTIQSILRPPEAAKGLPCDPARRSMASPLAGTWDVDGRRLSSGFLIYWAWKGLTFRVNWVSFPFPSSLWGVFVFCFFGVPNYECWFPPKLGLS